MPSTSLGASMAAKVDSHECDVLLHERFSELDVLPAVLAEAVNHAHNTLGLCIGPPFLGVRAVPSLVRRLSSLICIG